MEVRTDGSMAWRDNNPGNMETGGGFDYAAHGGIGANGHFEIFPDQLTGHNALVALLSGPTYQSLDVSSAIARFAPAVENNTTAYQAYVSKNVGVSLESAMSSLTAPQIESVANVIQHYEGWKPGTVTFH
jgi:hypothetical protein